LRFLNNASMGSGKAPPNGAPEANGLTIAPRVVATEDRQKAKT